MTRQFGWGDWTMVITFVSIRMRLHIVDRLALTKDLKKALALTQAIISVIQCTQAEKAFRTFILPPEVYYQVC